MSRYYIRTHAGWKENLTAAAAALGVGATVFYFARILIAREPLSPAEGSPVEGPESAGDERRAPESVTGPGN